MTAGGRLAGLAAAFLLVAAARGEPPPNLPESILMAKAALDADGFFLKDGPAPVEALERQWAAVRGWTADWLRTRPGAKPAAAAAALKAETGFDVTAVRLDGRSLLFAVTDDAKGDAFILRRTDDGRFATAWAVEAPGVAEVAAFPLVQAWSPSRAGADCRAQRPQADAGRCGPLTAEIATLRPDAGGEARFVLHGVYAQEMGATGGQLVSAWRWDGRAARPLLARAFTFMADQAQPVVDTRGGDLAVGSKGEWRQFFACGACEGRQSRTLAVVSAGGARWGPTASLTPEVDAVDALYDAVIHGRPTVALADPAAADAARREIAHLRSTTPKTGGDFILGMLLSSKVERRGLSRTLCLEFDKEGSWRYALARAGGGWRVASMAKAPDGACEGPGART